MVGMSSANLTREETALRAQQVSVSTIAVDLDLTGAPNPDVTGFPTTTTLTFTATTDQTWIDFIGESVLSVTLNGHDQPVMWDGARISITGLAADNIARIKAVGAYSRSGEGMHRYVDPADGATYLYTQYEPADSRRVMACFEQPDMKARYSFTVSAPAGWQVLSNGAALSITEFTTTSGATGPGVTAQRVEFAETLPLSSYITCVCAGPYHRVDATWTGQEPAVALGVLCRASLAEHLDADEIIEVTQQGLDFFTANFGFEYPGGKYDQIFVPEYNLGAMENPGLVTFTEAYVFRGASTSAQHEGRANTILHEMAHMWFGDLVTMKWWDDLWLKESFADYMGSHASVAATKFTDAWVTFANRRKAWAYQQDQLPTTHPIVADIPDLEAAKLNFDGITYAKGASVLKQLVAFVGEEAFFESARRYFARHAYGNTTLDDLLTVLAEVSGKDVHAWSRAWLETTGMSTLTLSVSGDDVTISQDVARPHSLQVGLYGWQDDALVAQSLVPVTITESDTTVTIPGAGDAALVVLNEGDWTYAKARLDEAGIAAVSAGLSTIQSPLSRALVWSSLWNAVRDAQLGADTYLTIVSKHAVNESNIALQSGVLANAFYAIEHYAPISVRDDLRAAWLDTTWDALWQAEAGSDAQLAWARAVGEVASVRSDRSADLQALLSGDAEPPSGLTLDADLRWHWLSSLIAVGAVKGSAADSELERDNTGSGRTAHVHATACVPTAEVRGEDWHRAWDDATLSNEHLSAVISGFTSGNSETFTSPYADEYFDRILAAWQTRSIEIARRLVVGLFPSADETDRAGAWLDANSDAPGALRRLVIEQRDHALRAARARSATQA
jgi:aminopeptidase N